MFTAWQAPIGYAHSRRFITRWYVAVGLFDTKFFLPFSIGFALGSLIVAIQLATGLTGMPGA